MVVGCTPLNGWIKHTVTGLANPHDAAGKNRVHKMERYILQGGDVNKPNKLGDTPLHEACAYIRDNGDSSKGKKRKAIAKDRRKVGKKLSRRQSGEGGALEMLELLVNAGSDINAQNIVGDAPLHKAALNGRARSADFLINAGANVNIRNEFAQTPLHAACVSGNIEVVQRLVQGGADTSAQDAAEDTPFHEACRHQYEGIVIYLMGLVNNPETSQGLKLWEGLDPSWEKILRDRAQAQAEDAEDQSEKAATITSAAAAAGLTSVRMGISTPSTTHNSLRSSESAMGLGLANRTPVRQGQFATTGGRERGGGVTVSVRGSGQEKKMAPSPGGLQARGGSGGDARKRGAAGVEAAAGGAGASSDGAGLNSTGGSRPGSRPGSATRRRRRDGERADENTVGHTRTFSTGAAEVLEWQATKAKSVQQERLIDKAREALREEQNEAAMSMSSTTLGEDDGSVDAADTPTTVGSRGSRPRSHRVRGNASPAAAAAAAGPGGEGGVTSGSRRGKTPSRSRTAAEPTATAAGGAPPEDRDANTVSPVMPTPPRSEVSVDTLVPPREVGRRQSARKSRTQVVALKSPAARVSRRSSGGGFSKTDNVDGSSRSRRSSRRHSSSRTSSDHGGGSSGAGGDAERSSRRSSGGRSSRPSASEREGDGHDASSSTAATAGADSARPRQRSSRRREGDGGAPREDGGAGGRGDARSPSSRRERPRRQGGDGETSGRSSPRASASGRKGHRSSRGQEGGNPGEGGTTTTSTSGSSSRRRESKRQSRSNHEGATANGATVGGVASSAPAAATTPAAGAAAVGAAAAAAGAGGLFQEPSTVAEAAKVPHQARTPRRSDGVVAHLMSHGTPSEARDTKRTPSRSSKEGRATPLRSKAAREDRATTPGASSAGSRSPAKAPKQRVGSRDLRPPTWASNVSSGLEEPSSRKRVIASDLPVRRVSPYNSTRQQGLLGAGGPPLSGVAPKHFSTSPGRPAASRPVAKTIDVRGGRDDDSCCGSSFDPDAKTEADSVSSSASSRPVWKAIELRGDEDDESCCGSSFEPVSANGDGVGSNGRPGGRTNAARIVSPQMSPPKTPALSVDDDFPPLIDALMMSTSEAASANGDSSRRSERAHKDRGKAAEGFEVSPTASKTSKPKITEIALAKSKSLLFSDSDSSDSDDDGRSSSTGGASQQASSASGSKESIAALSAVSRVFNSRRKADAAATTTAAPPPPAAAAASPSSATSVPSAETAPHTEVPAPKPALARPDGKSLVVEPSSAPRVSVQALPSTSTILRGSTKAGPAAGLSATGGLGGARGRPSALGRPGMAPAKVSMPIVGGRAAWNKFLASTAPEEAASDAAGGAATATATATAMVDASTDGSGVQRTDTGGDAVEEQDELLATRGPRGFKSAADSQEGPNKGPAGAFSGNAMWRLAAGTSSAANRARSGVAANGHGGYSNPLAAMRTGGIGAAAAAAAGGGSGTDGALGGGGSVANPLAGLRGAASMGGAGTANPLVRGRGARPGGAGGIANPMLRAGGAGGTANPLASASAASGGVLSSGPSATGPATKAAMPSGGVTAAAAASAEDVGKMVTAAGARGVASTTSAGGTKRAAVEGAIDLDRPTEFRAIGNNGSWHKGGIPVPPRRPRRAEPQVEADPGQAKVGGLVMALQNAGDARVGPMLKDLRNEDAGSTSSLTVLDRKGLVSLHRAKYSPRPPGPGMADSNGFDA
eukprot:g2992.t1